MQITPDTTNRDVKTYADNNIIVKHNIHNSKNYESHFSPGADYNFLKVLINMNSSISGIVSLSLGYLPFCYCIPWH